MSVDDNYKLRPDPMRALRQIGTTPSGSWVDSKFFAKDHPQKRPGLHQFPEYLGLRVLRHLLDQIGLGTDRDSIQEFAQPSVWIQPIWMGGDHGFRITELH